MATGRKAIRSTNPSAIRPAGFVHGTGAKKSSAIFTRTEFLLTTRRAMATLRRRPGLRKERPESTEQPVAQRQIRRPLASSAQDDQLLLEHEILCDHRSHANRTNQLRGHNGQVKQGEQDRLSCANSVGQISGATQRCANPGFSERI